MSYTSGQAIPPSEIIKRFKDEDGETFLEVRGFDKYLFRVTEGDRVYYKIEKINMKGEALTLIADYSHDIFEDIDTGIHEIPTAVHRVVHPEDLAKIFPSLDDSREETATETARASNRLDTTPGKTRPKNGEMPELNEGETIPAILKHLCKQNDYGGFTLRYNRFLYITDKHYRVDIKTPDSAMSYELEEYTPSTSSTPPNNDSLPATATPSSQEFNKGDYLPPHLRDQCEQELGTSGTSQITIGHFLYILDTQFRITQKMKISYMDDDSNRKRQVIPPLDFGGIDPEWEARAKKEKEDAIKAQKKFSTPTPQLSDKKIIENLITVFLKSLEKYKITANFFVEKALGPTNRETLSRAYKGDLSHLNDDTRTAAAQGQLTILKETGITLLKAALIHELYIKSTLAGRGDNMKFLITTIETTQPDGSIDHFPGYMSRQEQRDLMEFFKDQAEVYSDKTEMLKRVYRHLRSVAPDEYMELKHDGKEVTFNAFLVMKLYQQTTRLDRGDGITMIRICRDLLKYGKIKTTS